MGKRPAIDQYVRGGLVSRESNSRKKPQSLIFYQMRCNVPPQLAYSDKLWVTPLIERLNIPSG